MKRILLCLAVVVAVMLTLASPAAAVGPVSRTFSAYDLTQCSCSYSTPGNAYAYVNSAPIVTVTSYYDSTFTSGNVNTYQRTAGIDRYVLVGARDNRMVLANAASGGTYNFNYVLCWDVDVYSNQMDKIAAYAWVNGAAHLFIFKVADSAVTSYVRDPNHHC